MYNARTIHTQIPALPEDVSYPNHPIYGEQGKTTFPSKPFESQLQTLPLQIQFTKWIQIHLH